MKKANKWMGLAVFAAACLSGCWMGSDSANTDPVKAVASEAWNKLGDDAVVIRIGSNTCTKAKYEEYARVMLTGAEISNPGLPKEKFRVVLERNWPNMKDEVISRMLLDIGIQLTNVVDTGTFAEKVKRSYARRLSPKKQPVTFEKIQEVMQQKGLLEAFNRNFAIDLKTQTAFATTYSNELAVTDEEFKKVRANVASWNQRSQATNRLNQAEANHVRRLLDEGGDFAKLADTYSQDAEKNPGGDMGECDLHSLAFAGMDVETFEQTPYWLTVNSLKDGEVSPVLETNFGWEIVKMIGHVTQTNSNTGVGMIHLARIYFRRAYTYPEQDDDDFRADMLVEKRDELLKKIAVGVQKKNKVELPCGEAVFKPRSKKSEKKPKKPRGPIPMKKAPDSPKSQNQ